MPLLSNGVVDLIEAGLAGESAAGVGAAFFQALQPFGVSAIYARTYGVRRDVTTPQHTYTRISPPGWESLYAEKRFNEVNFLPREVRRRSQPFAWSEVELMTPAEHDLARVLVDCGFPDGLAVPCHGPHGYVAVVSLAFEGLDQLAPEERRAIEVASLVLHERMRALYTARADAPPSLSPRERDCMGFIAEGCSDSEIADRLGVGEATITTHVQSVRRKLGAKTRAQAVARCLIRNLL
jgi:DNA-binding CsgD family transcriptional regulator